MPDAENAAFVDLVFELGFTFPLNTVAVAPAKDPQCPVRADLDVAWLEQAAVCIRKNLERLAAGVALEQGTIPARPHNIGAFASPVVDEKHVAIRLWKLVERVVNHAGSGAVEKRSAMRCGRQVTAVGPVVAPCVPPAEVRAEERHENLVTFVLIIVRADEIEGVIHRHVPRVAKPSAGDLEVFAHGIASQDATLAAPVVRRMVVGVAVSFRCKRLGRRQVWGAGWRFDSPEFAEWLGGNPARLREALGVALGHVELAVRSPVEPVQRVLYVAEVGVNADVLVCDIVPVGVPHHCEVGRVGDVQIVALPCQPVNAVEAAGECFDLVGDTVVVVVDEDFNRVSGGVLLWFAKLRSLRDERPSTAVERNAGGIANEWFAGEETDLKSVRKGGEPGFVGVQISRVWNDLRYHPGEQQNR